jgi:predicted  nucleic acid-binding Zn-ribbon protein
MPHWNCARCGARLYSASKTLKRNNCPVCQGRLSPQVDLRPRTFEHAQPATLEQSDAAAHEVDVTEKR